MSVFCLSCVGLAHSTVALDTCFQCHDTQVLQKLTRFSPDAWSTVNFGFVLMRPEVQKSCNMLWPLKRSGNYVYHQGNSKSSAFCLHCIYACCVTLTAAFTRATRRLPGHPVLLKLFGRDTQWLDDNHCGRAVALTLPCYCATRITQSLMRAFIRATQLPRVNISCVRACACACACAKIHCRRSAPFCDAGVTRFLPSHLHVCG